MTIQIKGTLPSPIVGVYCAGAVIRFIATEGSTKVLEYTPAEAITDTEGNYNINLEYGQYSIECKLTDTFVDLGYCIINESSPTPMTLPELLQYTQPIPIDQVEYLEETWADALDKAKTDIETNISVLTDQVADGDSSVITQAKTYTNERLETEVAELTNQITAGDTQVLDTMTAYTDAKGNQYASAIVALETDNTAIKSQMITNEQAASQAYTEVSESLVQAEQSLTAASELYADTITGELEASLTSVIEQNDNTITESMELITDRLGNVESSWQVVSTIDELTSSIGMVNDGDESEVFIQADKLKFTSVIGGTPLTPFAVYDGVVYADKLVLGSGSSISYLDVIGNKPPSNATYGATQDQLDSIEQAFTDANAYTDTKTETFYSRTEPTEAVEGDMWVNTNNSNRVYTYTGSVWELFQEQDLIEGKVTTLEAFAQAAIAQATSDQVADELATSITDLNTALTAVQDQLDGAVTTWFYDYEPTLTNIPASDWDTNVLKEAHTSDLFYDTDTGYAYRFQSVNGTYTWKLLADSDVTLALQNAAAAQDTADSKRTVFTGSSLPSTPYQVGDLWAQGEDGDLLVCITEKTSDQIGNLSDWGVTSSYPSDIAEVTTTASAQAVTIANLDTTITEKEAALIESINAEELARIEAINERISEEALLDGKISDAEQATIDLGTTLTTAYQEYSNTVAQALIDGEISDAEAAAIAEAEVRVNAAKVALQSNIDSVSTNLQSLVDEIADLNLAQQTIDIAALDEKIDDTEQAYIAAILVESQERASDIAERIQAESELDGKITEAEQATINLGTTLTEAYKAYVVEVNEALEDNILTAAESAAIDSAALLVEEAKKALQDNIDGVSEDLDTFVDTTYFTAYTELQEQIDSKTETWVQLSTDTDPSNSWSTGAEHTKHDRDTLYYTDLNQLFYYDASNKVWVKIENSDAIEALATATLAGQIADGKINTFYQGEAPEIAADGSSEGDIWIDTSKGNSLKLVKEDEWVTVDNEVIAETAEVAAYAEALADSKARVYYSSEAPTEMTEGDLWVNLKDTNRIYRWSGVVWDSIADIDIVINKDAVLNSIANIVKTQAIADRKIVVFTSTATEEELALAEDNDIWFKTVVIDGVETLTQYIFTAGAWVKSTSTEAGELALALTSVEAKADSKVVMFYGSVLDTYDDVSQGDLLIDTTSETNSLYYWVDGAWEIYNDYALQQLKDELSNQITTTTGTTAPSEPKEGDIWYNTATNTCASYTDAAGWTTISDLTDYTKNLLTQDQITGSGIYPLLADIKLQSVNYSLGSTGFAIDTNGTAEFNSITIRNSVLAGRMTVDDNFAVGDNFSITEAGGVTVQGDIRAETLTFVDGVIPAEITNSAILPGEVYRQDTEPTDTSIVDGDIWFNTGSENAAYIYTDKDIWEISTAPEDSSLINTLISISSTPEINLINYPTGWPTTELPDVIYMRKEVEFLGHNVVTNKVKLNGEDLTDTPVGAIILDKGDDLHFTAQPTQPEASVGMLWVDTSAGNQQKIAKMLVGWNSTEDTDILSQANQLTQLTVTAEKSEEANTKWKNLNAEYLPDTTSLQIKSDSYVDAVGNPTGEGWAIDSSGTAEFNNVTARGHIEAISGSFPSSLMTGTLTANQIGTNVINTTNIIGGAVTRVAQGSGSASGTYSKYSHFIEHGNSETVLYLASNVPSGYVGTCLINVNYEGTAVGSGSEIGVRVFSSSTIHKEKSISVREGWHTSGSYSVLVTNVAANTVFGFQLYDGWSQGGIIDAIMDANILTTLK